LTQIKEVITEYIEVARKFGKPISVEVSIPVDAGNARI